MSIFYEKEREEGLYKSVRKSRFDSKSEEKVCLVLNHILLDYGLEKYMDIRLTPQQPLDNYVEETDERYMNYYKNKHKWMKFDFIFENVYEFGHRMNYIPVAVVEFDGPSHDEEEQIKLDKYKNGVANNIGAGIVRIKYNELKDYHDIDSFEKELRDKYENDIIEAILTGYFTKTVNFRKEKKLIDQEDEADMKKFNKILKKYVNASKENPQKAKYYYNLLIILNYLKDAGSVKHN